MSDQECLELLRLLHKYVTEFFDFADITSISDVVEDIAMSMNVTTDEADTLRREICARLA